MPNIIKLVQGDTKPSLVVTLTDEATAVPINLTGASLLLKFREAEATELTASIAGNVLDPVNGTGIFHWPEDALSGEPGNYEGEVEITYADATVQTVYVPLYFYMREQF